MNLRRILVLLVLVAALGVYLWRWELPQAEREGKKDKLLAVDKEAVTGVSLVYPDRTIELKKEGDAWRVVQPVDAPADEVVVKSVVSTLADAEVQKTIDDPPSDLAPFGLDKPTVTARLTLKDGTQTAPVAVGKNTSIGGKTYVRKGDEPKLLLTTSTIGYGLNKQVKDLRDKQLLVFQDDDVKTLEIAHPDGQGVLLTRKDKDAWTLDPGSKVADATEVRSYLSSLRATRAIDFPTDAAPDLATYGLTAPRLTVTLGMAKDGAAPVTLLLGGETTEGTQKQVYAKRADRPTVVTIGDWSLRTLDKSASQFRDKTVLGFDPARVGRLTIERKDGGGTTLKRADAGWQIDAADAKPVKADTVSRYLDDLKDLRGSDVAAEPPGDLAAFGLDAPELRVTLADKDGQPLGTVVAAKHEAKYYAMRTGGDTVYEARDYMYTRLDKRQGDFTGENAPPAVAAPVTPKVVPAEPDADSDDGEAAPDEDEGGE